METARAPACGKIGGTLLRDRIPVYNPTIFFLREGSRHADTDEAYERQTKAGSPSARRNDHVRRRYDRAGAGRRGRRHAFRLQRRCDFADLRCGVPVQREPLARGRDSPGRPSDRAGRRLHGRGLRALERAGRSLSGDFRPRGDQRGDADSRLPGRFRSGRVDLWPGPARGDGHRRVPGSPDLQHHVVVRQARLSSHRRDQGRGDRFAAPSTSRAAGGPGPVVIDVPKDVQNCRGDLQGRGPVAVARLSRARPGRSGARDFPRRTSRSSIRSAGVQQATP